MTKTLWLCLAVIVAFLAAVGEARAWTETVLHSFTGADGAGPWSTLVFDSAGNLYGTTQLGGSSGHGTVFKLTPPVAGTTAWTETVLHNFTGVNGGCVISDVVLDTTGNLYYTASCGGVSGFGGVFKLSPPVAGARAWTQTEIHRFTGPDGAIPGAALVFDAGGNLYGTTRFGGASNFGTVFKLTPRRQPGRVHWKETVLHSFTGHPDDGSSPFAGVVFGPEHALYGTTQSGGYNNSGTVFQLLPPASGQTGWIEREIYNFTSDEPSPYGGVVLDGAGNVYGSSYYGCCNNAETNAGLVFELTKAKRWTPTVIHLFSSTEKDGAGMSDAMILDNAGNLYGTTGIGGAGGPSGAYGTVFKMTPPALGTTSWQETILKSFTDDVGGGGPWAGVIFDAAGNLYGTTLSGGAFDKGVVFKLSP